MSVVLDPFLDLLSPCAVWGSLRAALEGAGAVLPPLDVGPATPAGRRLARTPSSTAECLEMDRVRH